MVRRVISTFAALAIAVPLAAQSASRPSVALDGPAPRLADGTPDLSGVWQGGGPIGDIAQGLPPGQVIPILPEAKKIMDADPTWYGHSIGRWEGSTLVVDTVGFNDKFWFDFKGHPHTEKLHIVERYTRASAGTLINEITIDDPGAYARPFKVTFTAKLSPGDELIEYICNENNQDVSHIQGPPAEPGDTARPLGTLRTR